MGNIEDHLRVRIKQLRKDAGLSQSGLASMAGVSVQTIRDIEAGRRGAGLRALEGIAKALSVSMDEIKGDKEPIVQKIITHKMKDYTRRVEAIPDDIYDLAVDMGDDKEGWDMIRVIFKNRIKNQAKSESKKAQA